MAKKQKVKKTLVEQILQKAKINHTGLQINALEGIIPEGITTDQIYKTLALTGDKTGPVIGIVPISAHLSEKKLAKLSGNKKVSMIPQKDLEKTMGDMNAGVEAFRAKLESLGAKNIGIYIGTYFMEEHSISTDKFTALWIPTYGYDDGYYNAAPSTDDEYDLHQYTSQGQLNGFTHYLDLNQIAPTQDQEKIYRKLFTVEKN